MVGVALLQIALVCAALGYRRRNASVNYALDDQRSKSFATLSDAFRQEARGTASWRILTEHQTGSLNEYKANAGASSTLRRAPATLRVTSIPRLKSNLAFPAITLQGATAYFLPDRLLIDNTKSIDTIDYEELTIQHLETNWIEEGLVPQGAVRVGQTWKYVNKNGGPDRRYRENRELPILRYSEWMLTHPRLTLRYQFSRPGAAANLATAIETYTRDSRE
jgi:hypothetical protein